MTALGVLSGILPEASALTIIRDFKGGTPPLNSIGTGSLVDVFNEAADQWERTIQDPHTLIVHYGWGPGTYHLLLNQGGTPHRETEAFISFNNDNVEGHHKYYLDPTPHLNEEYLSYSEASINLGGGDINVGRVFYNATGDASAGPNHLDLLTGALHEIGHALGLSVSNWSWLAESWDGDIDVTAPRPFVGTSIPLEVNGAGQATSHLANNLVPGIPSPVMGGHAPHQRYLLSELDILAIAELSEFKSMKLNPYNDGNSWYDSLSGDQRFPWADYNEATGEYLILWQDNRNGRNDDIYGVRWDQEGNRIGNDFPVSMATGHQQRVLVKAGGGGWLAVWHDLRNQSAHGADIFGAWIDGKGNVGPEMVICSCPSDQWNPVAGYDPVSDSFLVVWLDGRGSTNNQTGNPNDNYDLYGVVIPAGGSGSLTPFPVIAANNGQRGPQIGYDYENNQYYLAWNDRRGSDYDIYGARVTTSGASLDGAGTLLIGASGNQFRPTVADRRPVAGINNHFIAWMDYRNGAKADVYGAYVDGNGVVVGSDIAICSDPGEEANVVADVDWINTKKNVLSWIRQQDPQTYFNVITGTVDQVGGVTCGGPLNPVADEQRANVVTYATDGINDYGFLEVSADRRNGTDYDIWGTKVWP